MNMEQINTMMQLMMQQSQMSASGAGKDSNGDSFQDMMSQKQDAVSSSKPTSNDKQTQTQSKPTQNDKVQQTEQTPEENVPEVSDDVRQTLAAMLFQPYVVQDVAVQQPVQENVDMVSAMPTVDAVVTQTVQTAVVAETAAPVVQQEAAQPTVQVPQQTATVEQGQTAPEVVVPQENIQQQGMQNAATQTEQQPTGEGATGQKMAEVEQPDDQPVVVTQQEQPLFREVETVPVKVGEATPTIDVNAPDMEKQLADTIQANLNNVGDKVQIQLQPENLGHITIELAQHGGKLGLVIYADNAKTTSLLAQHAGNLGALLEDRTGQTVHIQVQQQEPEQPQYDGHNQQNRQQQEQQSHPQQSKAEQDSFLGQLRLGLYQLDTV